MELAVVVDKGSDPVPFEEDLYSQRLLSHEASAALVCSGTAGKLVEVAGSCRLVFCKKIR